MTDTPKLSDEEIELSEVLGLPYGSQEIQKIISDRKALHNACAEIINLRKYNDTLRIEIASIKKENLYIRTKLMGITWNKGDAETEIAKLRKQNEIARNWFMAIKTGYDCTYVHGDSHRGHSPCQHCDASQAIKEMDGVE